MRTARKDADPDPVQTVTTLAEKNTVLPVPYRHFCSYVSSDFASAQQLLTSTEVAMQMQLTFKQLANLHNIGGVVAYPLIPPALPQ